MKTKKIQINDMGEIEISFPYNQELVAVVKGMFSKRRFDKERKVWALIPTEQNIENLFAFAEQYDFDIESVPQDAEQIIKNYRVCLGDASFATQASLVIPGLGGTLYPFQKAGVAYAARTKRCFIADEMGLGKTVQALATVQYANAYPALVVCPAGLKLNWEQECRRWLPGRSVVVLNNNSSVLINFDVTIINYELLTRHLAKLDKQRFLTIIFDEAHYLKNYDSGRSRSALSLVNHLRPPYRLLLTGTPILNRPKELIHPLKLLGKLEDMGGFDYFADHYCDAVRRGNKIWDMDGAANLDELNQKLRSCCYIRRAKEQVLPELPEKQRTFVPVELANHGDYMMAKKNLFSWFKQQANKRNVTVAGYHDNETLLQTERLRQVAAVGKMEAVIDWINTFLESGEKLVVFAHRLKIIDTLAKTYSLKPVTGQTSLPERQRIVEDFQANSKRQMILLGIQAGGQGLTLHAASNVLFVEPTWTPAELDQAEGRLHRIGQRGAVQAWYLVARGTIEDDIYELIERKREIVGAVTQGSVLEELIARLRQQAHSGNA